MTDSGAQRADRATADPVADVGHVGSGGEVALARVIDARDHIDAHIILAEEWPPRRALPMRERTRDLPKDRSEIGVPLLPSGHRQPHAPLAPRQWAIRPDLIQRRGETRSLAHS